MSRPFELEAGKVLICMSKTSPLINELQSARQDLRFADIDRSGLPTTLEQAYDFAVGSLPAVAGWKIGGVNAWSQSAFGNHELFVGPLISDEIHIGTQALEIDNLFAPLAEPEIVLEVGRAPSVDSLSQFSRIGLGIEVPTSALPPDLRSNLMAQIVDRAGAGALWVGQLWPFTPDECPNDFQFQFSHNDSEPQRGTSTSVIGGPIAVARDMIRLASVYGWPVQSGQLIACGGLCRAVPIKAGDVLTFSALGREAVLQLR